MSKRTKAGRVKNPPAEEVSKDLISRTTICQFCHQGETKDILQSGRLYKLSTGKGSVEYYHYFCLLFSSKGIQRGKDEEGLNGFLLEDIKNEVKRGAVIKCDICKKSGATIPCHIKKCKKNYHFSCGAEASPEHLYVFRNNMDSFCWNHAPQQKKISHVVSDATCMVCLDNSLQTPGPGPGRLVSPCCGRTFHRDCIQKTALQAGKVSLKCPACNTKDKFNDEMERCGIYIPHADATWEMPENSNFYGFEDMLNLYRNCDAEACLSTKGRDYSKVGTTLELVKCQTCGQSGVHISCGKLDMKNPIYVCSTCQPKMTDGDSDDDDEDLHAILARHEDRRRELLEKKEKIIQEQKISLAATKRKQDEMIQRIKDIFAPDPVEKNEFDDRKGVGVTIINTVTGEPRRINPQSELPISYRLPSNERPRTAIGMPRKSDNDVSEDDGSDDDDEELKGVLKISAVFSGDDVGKLKDILPQNCLASPPKDRPPSDDNPEVTDALEEDEDCDSLEDLLEDKFIDDN